MKKVSIYAVGLLFVTSMLVASAAFADQKPKKPSPSAPIDAGISLLLAAGVGLGVKKVLDRRKHA